MLNLVSQWTHRAVVCISLFLVSLGLHAQQTAIVVEGTLQIVWGDPHPERGGGGEIRYSLAMADGSVVPLELLAPDGQAMALFGKPVTVSGLLVSSVSGRAAVPGASGAAPLAGIVVQNIQLSSSAQPNAAATADGQGAAPVFGTKKVIYLLVKFSDDASVPHPPSFYTNLNNPDTPPQGESFPATVNGFFKKTSWGQFSWLGDVGGVGGVGASGGWLTLPNPKSYYANCGWSGACASLSMLGDDATALGRAQGINFKNYDNINFVLSNDLDCCAWGGSYYSSVDNKTYGTTWEPPWGQEAGTYAHEMGHSLGLPHSGWVYEAYDSPWDMMSNRRGASDLNCGSYFSRNSNATSTLYCSEPGDGYIAAHKDYLGWIPTANVVVTDTTSSVTTTLEASALALGSAAKIIKICLPGYPCTGSTARYFTVEARVGGLGTSSQYDNGLAGEGIIIHEFRGDRPAISGSCFFNSQSGWALPVDATPNDYDFINCNGGNRAYPNYALNNAQWSAGQTYTNSQYGFMVSVVSRSGTNFVVVVAATTYPLSAARSGSGTGTVTSSPAGINCGATCSASFAFNTSVTLSASPASGSVFAGWSGACSGAGSCVLSMSSPQSVTATFTVLTQPSAPGISSVTPGIGQLTFALSAPTNTGGGPITSYTVTCSAAGQPTVSSSSGSLTVVVSGLKPGTSYSCTATASNGSFSSPASAGSVAVVKSSDLTPLLMLLLD